MEKKPNTWLDISKGLGKKGEYVNVSAILYVSKPPESRTTATGKLVATTSASINGHGNYLKQVLGDTVYVNNADTVWVDIVAWENQAQWLEKAFNGQGGLRFLFCGALSLESYEKNGDIHTRVKLTVRKFSKLATANKATTPQNNASQTSQSLPAENLATGNTTASSDFSCMAEEDDDVPF